MKRYIIAVAVILSLVIPAAVSAQSATSSCINLSKDMQFGSRDVNANGKVTVLQGFLISKGYLNASSTGYFGPMTLAAVKKYQATSTISQTGFVGPLTRASIKAKTCGGLVLSANTSCPVGALYSVETGKPCLLSGGGSNQITFTGGGNNSITNTVITNTTTTDTTNTTDTTATSTATTTITYKPGDINGDNQISISDFIDLAAMFGKNVGDAGFSPAADLDNNGTINGVDFRMFNTLMQLANYGPNIKSGDTNNDGTVSIADYIDLAAQFGKKEQDEGYDAKYDLDYSGAIDKADFAIMEILFKADNGQ
jgi:hypothetical protein